MTVKWSPDDQYLLTISGDRFLTGSQDYDLFLWNVQTGEQVASVESKEFSTSPAGELGTTSQHFMTGAGASFASDGRVATLGGDNTALIWDPMLTDQELILNRTYRSYQSPLTGHLDFTHLATASEDGTVRIWDAQNGHGIDAIGWTQWWRKPGSLGLRTAT